MDRRHFIKRTGLAAGALTLGPLSGFSSYNIFPDEVFISKRPPLNKRTFISPEVEKVITETKSAIKDEEIAWMFENCFPNTLDTTVDYEILDRKPDTFIITGDIDAMWLRDSTAQVWPYMPLIKNDVKLRNLILGLINRQVKCVLRDPYANAFYKDLERKSEWASDRPSPGPGVHERKWEVDSLCNVIRLSYRYHELTGDKSPFDPEWDKAMRLIIQTFRTEQRKDGTSPYYFQRKGFSVIDAPAFGGTGRPIKPTGMICSMFRPSDDATLFPFLVPSNIFAMQSLRQLGRIYGEIIKDTDFASECNAFAAELEEALRKYAISEHLDFGEIFAYEADGFGNLLFMDDANVPSLMSLAYLDPGMADEPVYHNTRKFLLSDSNPYFLRGKAAEGQASPHTGKDKIWPMGIILRAMTSQDNDEIIHCLQMLKDTHAGTGFMHEAFNKDNPEDYSRSWFAWANTLFGELILKIHKEKPEILALDFNE